jgi:hypothetical protein
MPRLISVCSLTTFPFRNLKHLTSVLGVLVLTQVHCEERLPAYIEPQQTMRAVVDPHFFYGPRISDTMVVIFVNVVNVFDETFQAEIAPLGSVEIELAKDITFRKQIVFDVASLYDANYDPLTRVLTINPHETVRFRVTWNLIDENDRDLRKFIFHYKPDTFCASRARKFAARETFVLNAQVKLFDKTGVSVAAPLLWTMCHVTGWAESCADFPTDGSCQYYDYLPRSFSHASP